MRFWNRIVLLLKVVKNISNWHVYLLDFMKLYPRGKVLWYNFRSGISYQVRSGMADRWILNEVVLRNAYFPEGITLHDGDTVIDIGAHIGTFTVTAAQKCPHGKVVACEPHPNNFNILSENIRKNKFANVVALNKAAAGTTGERSFFINKDDSDRHTLIQDFAVNKNDAIPVSTISLEDLAKEEHLQHINLLKIDCEGCEYELLNEKNNGILNETDQIITEIHDLGNPQKKIDLISFIEKKGFHAYGKNEGVTYFIKTT